MKWYVFLWESAAADRDGIVAGAYSAEVALATKAGSHSHKSDTSLPIGRWPVMVSWMILIALHSSAFSLNT